MKRTLLAGTLGVLLGLGIALYPPNSADAKGKSDPCCKYCKKGKACGDTCIKATDTCNSPPGCACDG